MRQIDVFASAPLGGNPVAVVHDADDLTDGQMAAFARWTNLSETTFLLTPTAPGADYRVRIFTPAGELPFAGHPTLGTAHAWLEAGGTPTGDVVRQECGIGLVPVRLTDDRLTFAAPPLTRSGAPSSAELAQACAGLGITPDDVADASWLDNGPHWLGLRLPSARAVLALEADYPTLDGLYVGVVGPWADDAAAPGDADVEVRAFIDDREDPVTGSLNAGIGQWLAGGALPASYVASQGTALRRRGRVHVASDDAGQVWVGGATTTVVTGTATF
jgi:PhzF family phenazine biosynthesis protein